VSRPNFVPEEPLRLPPGVGEMLADPSHFRRSPMMVVDYGEAVLDLDPEPLPSLADAAKRRSRWARFRAALTGGKA
jgi:hypothetical protein